MTYVGKDVHAIFLVIPEIHSLDFKWMEIKLLRYTMGSLPKQLKGKRQA